MGENKAFIPLGQKPIITHVLSRLAQVGAAETVIVTRSPSLYGSFDARVINDEGAGRGALNGIYSALCQCETPYIFVVGCDMPFIDPAWIQWIYDIRADYDAVVPVFGGFPQSLHALYHQRCLTSFAEQLTNKVYRMESALEHINTHFIPEDLCRARAPSGKTFFNINTPEDLARAKAMVAEASLE